MPAIKAEWRMMYEAPVGKPVLVWIAPLNIPAFKGSKGRFEVGVANYRDPRSGKVVQKYASNCRWTQLPQVPRQRIRGE
jgi:hypothetical protein